MRYLCLVAQRSVSAAGVQTYKIDPLRPGCSAGAVADVIGGNGWMYNFTTNLWELPDFYIALRSSEDPYVLESFVAAGDDSLFIQETAALAVLIIGAIFVAVFLLIACVCIKAVCCS